MTGLVSSVEVQSSTEVKKKILNRGIPYKRIIDGKWAKYCYFRRHYLEIEHFNFKRNGITYMGLCKECEITKIQKQALKKFKLTEAPEYEDELSQSASESE